MPRPLDKLPDKEDTINSAANESLNCSAGAITDARLWLMKLQRDGRGYSTITSVRGVAKPAFQMAYEEDILWKSPFDFKLSNVLKHDAQKRVALPRVRLIYKQNTYTIIKIRKSEKIRVIVE